MLSGCELARRWRLRTGSLGRDPGPAGHDPAVGNYKLAFAVLFAWAALRPSRELIVPLASARSLAALLHALYHALHLDGFGAGDAIALAAVLVAALALPALAVVITQRERVRDHARMNERALERA